MTDAISALYQYAMNKDLYLRFMDDPNEYASSFSASAAIHDRLRSQLDAPTQKLLETFLDERATADSILLEASFATGLAFGLQLLGLL